MLMGQRPCMRLFIQIKSRKQLVLHGFSKQQSNGARLHDLLPSESSAACCFGDPDPSWEISILLYTIFFFLFNPINQPTSRYMYEQYRGCGL